MTTLRQLAEAAQRQPWEPVGYSPPIACIKAFRDASTPAAILALLDTIDAQRKLLERAESVLSASYGDAYDEALEADVWKDITSHLESMK